MILIMSYEINQYRQAPKSKRFSGNAKFGNKVRSLYSKNGFLQVFFGRESAFEYVHLTRKSPIKIAEILSSFY